MDKSMYCSQISDLISAIIIYLCSFVLFFKTVMNRGIAKSEEKKARLEKQAALSANTEKGGDQLMVLLIQYTLLFASVLLLVALGGCFSEHSGVINLGLEGIMVMGALGGALMMRYLPDGTPAALMVLRGNTHQHHSRHALLLPAGCSLPFNCNADQTIVGTAMNLLGTAAATVIVKAINTAANPDDVSSTIQYVGAKKAFTCEHRLL